MKLKQHFCFGVSLLFLALTLRSEPLNLVVGDLTFTRPLTWKYEPPSPGSPAVTRFVVAVPKGQPGAGIGFYVTNQPPATAVNLWNGYFTEKDAQRLPVENKTIGHRTITYASMQGTMTLRVKPSTDQMFVGAVIPWEDKFIHVRLVGPMALVEKSLPDFKAMVEQAVTEAEDDKESGTSVDRSPVINLQAAENQASIVK